MDATPSRMAALPDVAERTLPRVVDQALSSATYHIADIAHGATVPLADVVKRARSLHGALVELGLEPQTPVLTMLDNTIPHIEVWLALGLGGFIGVPVNTAFHGSLLDHVVQDSAASVAVVQRRYLDLFHDSSAGSIKTFVVVDDDAPEVGDGFEGPQLIPYATATSCSPVVLPDVRPWDVHSVMYTSGTTGRSKGAVVSHAQTFTRSAIVDVRSRRADRDVSLVTLPLFHVVGQCRGLYSALIYGADIALAERFSVSEFWGVVRRHDVTYTSLLGSMAQFIFSGTQAQQTSLETVIMAPVIPQVEAFSERFGVEVVSSYGSTEAGTVTVGRARPGSCGQVHPEFEGIVADEHDRPVPLGEPGELLLRPRIPWTMTAGYWNNPDATVKVWRNLWFHTGDRMSMDATGELTFIGRDKEMIRRRGENMSALEIEAIVTGIPGVASCAAVAVPSKDVEEELKVVLVLEPPRCLIFEDLLREMAERLPYFMVPRYIQVVESLPMTPTNKVDKGSLASIDEAWDREAHGWRVTRRGARKDRT